MRKPVFGVSYLVSHKPGCAITEYDYILEIWEGFVERLHYPSSENKGADQLLGHRGHPEADLRLCFHICKKPVFS